MKPTNSQLTQVALLKKALWAVRLRDNCWCLNPDMDKWHRGAWTHDHRCRAAREAMK